MTLDSSDPEFWQTRFEAGRIPWDKPTIPKDLSEYITKEHLDGKQVLIPGCGSAHEGATFVKAGCQVTGIDFCEAAVESARKHSGVPAGSIICGDFFAQDFRAGSFDLIYERAFLCSMPPRLWPKWGERVKELLKPGGRLIGYFFHAPADDEGPPFGLSPRQIARLLGREFICMDDRGVYDSVEVFAGGEHWQVWEYIS